MPRVFFVVLFAPAAGHDLVVARLLLFLGGGLRWLALGVVSCGAALPARRDNGLLEVLNADEVVALDPDGTVLGWFVCAAGVALGRLVVEHILVRVALDLLLDGLVAVDGEWWVCLYFFTHLNVFALWVAGLGAMGLTVVAVLTLALVRAEDAALVALAVRLLALAVLAAAALGVGASAGIDLRLEGVRLALEDFRNCGLSGLVDI